LVVRRPYPHFIRLFLSECYKINFWPQS